MWFITKFAKNQRKFNKTFFLLAQVTRCRTLKKYENSVTFLRCDPRRFRHHWRQTLLGSVSRTYKISCEFWTGIHEWCSPERCSPTFSLLHILHRLSKNQKPMRKTLKLDWNLTLIFFFDAHSLHPHPHFASRLDTAFVQILNIKLLNVKRANIRRASVGGASVWKSPFVLPLDIYETIVSF
jgi:hypothetical protein